MSGSVRGSHYVINDESIAYTLRRHGYEVVAQPHNWYVVSPEIGTGITMLSGVPFAKQGVNVISLLGFLSISSRVEFYKEACVPPDGRLRMLEELRKLLHYAIPLTAGNIRRGVESNLEYVTGEVLALGYTPASLVNPRATAEFTVTAPFRRVTDIDEWSDRMVEIKHRVEDIPFKVTLNDDCLDKMNALALPTYGSMQRLRDAIAEPLRKIDYEEDEPEPATPGSEYIEKATNFKQTLSPEEAVSSMLTCYNNAAYEDHRSAADQIEAMINELGYTVVRGFDDTDPAQIVKTL